MFDKSPEMLQRDCNDPWMIFRDLSLVGGIEMKRKALLLLFLSFCVGVQAQHVHGVPEKLGAVSFPTSCSAQTQGSFNRAVALLHSFAYAPAVDAFGQVAREDPGCAMAHWGAGMSYYHQLWQPPFPGDGLQKGRAELERAQQIGTSNAREKEFLGAASLLFLQDSDAYAVHAAKYRDAMAVVAQHHPEDAEAQIFYALALLATANPQDKTHQNQKTAGQILEPLYQKYPQHPGVAHYLIHAYDNAELASKGLGAAREYSQIAPSAPHALHMPSHIFTRLGMWQESVESNQAARMAARQQGDVGEELHDMDYMVYASLQQGRDAEAAAVIKDLRSMTLPTGSDFKVGYAGTAMPVRYAVERKHWDEATRCVAPEGAPPQVTALAAWARALGYARSGNTTAAQIEVQSLQRLTDQLRAAGNQYWAGQVQIQTEEAGSWIALAAHKTEDAVALMRQAADEEDAVEKLPVTPGPVVPAREQLGDMLAQLGQPAAALAAYETTLRDSPGRRGALQGALSSSRAAGLKSKTTYYEAAISKLQ